MNTSIDWSFLCVGSIIGENVLDLRQSTPHSLVSTQFDKSELAVQLHFWLLTSQLPTAL